MIISCPSCNAQYKIDPSGSKKSSAKVKCPACSHHFEITLESSEPLTDVVETSKPLVLIVDDARFFRQMIKDILQDLPVLLDEAADGLEAWQKILDTRPQLVLLDLNIPGKDGQELLRDLRENKDLDSVRVLAMSGVLRDDETSVNVRRLGADDFLNKSFKPRDLQKRVLTILGL
jgi:predicted Zn finger-like uncharacterized protein